MGESCVLSATKCTATRGRWGFITRQSISVKCTSARFLVATWCSLPCGAGTDTARTLIYTRTFPMPPLTDAPFYTRWPDLLSLFNIRCFLRWFALWPGVQTQGAIVWSSVDETLGQVEMHHVHSSPKRQYPLSVTVACRKKVPSCCLCELSYLSAFDRNFDWAWQLLLYKLCPWKANDVNWFYCHPDKPRPSFCHISNLWNSLLKS